MSRATQLATAELFRQLASETDESAAVSLFVELCRGSPALRHWLWEDFARDPAKRAHFARLLRKGVAKTRFADLSGEGSPWHEETRRLRAQLPRHPYGGRSFAEIKELLFRHQAGKTDAAAFLFALEWHRLRPKGTSPRLLRGAFAVFDAAMDGSDAAFIRQLAEAKSLAREFAGAGRRRAALGFGDWWKVNALLYILRHPAPRYRTRELQAHLASLSLKVAARDIRRFCLDAGIARDERAGRPTGAVTRARVLR